MQRQARWKPGGKFRLLPVFLINNMRDIPIIDKFVHLREMIRLAR